MRDTPSDKSSSAANGLGQERPDSSVTPARAGAGNQHGKAPVEIKLPWPPRSLQSNSRAHWGTKATATAKARQEAAMVAKQAGVGCWPDADILIEYWPANRRSDCHNAASAMKPLIDGIADAMGVDDKRFRVDFPSMFAGTRKGGEVVFRIYSNSHRKEQ